MGFRRQPVQLALLIAVAAGTIYARTLLGPIQETMRKALALSDNQVALLQGLALAVPFLLLSVPLGLLIDRWRRPLIMVGLCAICVVGSIISVLAHDFWLLLAGRSLVGLCAPAANITAIAIIADLFEEDRRGRANMALAIVQVAAMSAAFGVGGWLVVSFDHGLDDWRYALAWGSAPLLLATMLSFGIIDRRHAQPMATPPSSTRSVKDLWALRSLLGPLITAVTLVGIADGAALIWAAPMFERHHGLNPQETGAIMSGALLVGGFAGPAIGGLLADFGHRHGGPQATYLLLIVLALLSAGAGLFGIAPGYWAAAAGFLLFMTAGSAISVSVGTLTTIVMPRDLRGLSLAFLSGTGIMFGLGVAPLTVSFVSGLLGGPEHLGSALALVCTSTSVAGAIIFHLGRKAVRREGAEL
jgi:MFS family permease